MQTIEILGAQNNIFELWEKGARELERSAPGRIITAPIRLFDTLFQSTGKTLEAVPKAVNTVPLLLIILAGGVAACLIYSGKKGTKLI